jgi:hypothetical protein
VFSHHGMKVIWSSACVVIINTNEVHADTHFIYRFCDGNAQVVVK